MIDLQPFKQIRTALADSFRRGGGRVVQRDGEREVIAYDTSCPDKALAKLAEFLDSPEVCRLDAHLGRELAHLTNPEAFRRSMDQQARAYVIRDKPVPEFSVDWANLLDDQRIISLTITRDMGKRQAAPGVASTRKTHASLTPDEIDSLKKDIVAEICFSVRQEQQQSGPTVTIARLDIVCRDPAQHAYLERITDNTDAWTKTLKNILMKIKGVALLSCFVGGYRFEPNGPRTAPLGQGSLLAVIHAASNAMKKEDERQKIVEQVGHAANSARTPEHQKSTTTSAANSSFAGGTYEIGDVPDYFPVAHIRCSVVGSNMIESIPPLSLQLPGKITRPFLATALAQLDPHSLRLVSEDKHALEVFLEGDCLMVSAKVRQKTDGSQKAIYFLVGADGHETPLVGKKKIPDGRTAVILIGGDSNAQGRDREGHLLRPIKVEIGLPARG